MVIWSSILINFETFKSPMMKKNLANIMLDQQNEKYLAKQYDDILPDTVNQF